MRILLVTNMYPPHHLGGYELSCRDVVERLRTRGHAVTVLTTSYRRPGVPAADEPRDEVRRSLDFYWRDDRPWRPPARRVFAIERLVRREIEAALEEIEPDVVSLWNMGAIPMSAITTLVRSGRPLVYHVCNDWPSLNLQVDGFHQLLKRRPRLVGAAARVLGIPTSLPDLGASGTFCWVSRSTWETAARETPWEFPRSTVVHSGINHVDFPPVDPPSAARQWQGRLLYVGRIEPTKGTMTLVEALAHLDGMTADLVGPATPRYLANLLRRAEELGVADRVTTASVDRHELRRRYLAADAVVFTSHTEPFGLVPIEAMACATPVVASGVGGSKEFLADGENCLVYPAGDAQALAKAVERLRNDPELRLSLSRRGLETAAAFSVDRLADRLEAAHLAACGAVAD